jgi:hypothetical protein
MICSEAKKLMIEDLETALLPEIQEHLEDCLECRKLAEYLSTLEDLNRALSGQHRAPADFAEKVIDEVERQVPRSSFLRPSLALVFLIPVLAGIGWNQWQSRADETTVVTATDDLSERQSPNPSIQYQVKRQSGKAGRPPFNDKPAYVEVLLNDPSGNPYVVRIPSTIRIRQTEAQRGYLTYVSH